MGIGLRSTHVEIEVFVEKNLKNRKLEKMKQKLLLWVQLRRNFRSLE